MIVWCIIAIIMDLSDGYTSHDTAVRGKVIRTEKDYYYIDFSEYAKKQHYQGDFSSLKIINKSDCIDE